MSRQNYYSARRRRERREIDESSVVELTIRERALQPRLGGRKVRQLIGPELERMGLRLGRDRYFEILRGRGLLVGRRRRKPRTTNSRHSLPVFRNIVAGRRPSGPDEIWVSDLTYIDTSEGFMYAALIMDMYSRKIVGSHIGDSLETEGCVLALEEALSGLPDGKLPIHHSDRGSQYCSHMYVGRLKEAGLSVSMTEELHCYENAHAERLNGTLKDEYGMGDMFRTKMQSAVAFKQGVHLYNTRRPHMGIGCRIPSEVHSKGSSSPPLRPPLCPPGSPSGAEAGSAGAKVAMSAGRQACR